MKRQANAKSIFDELIAIMDKPCSKWGVENDKDLGAQIEAFLSKTSEKAFSGQLNSQKSLKDHFLYLIYKALKEKIEDDSDISVLLQDSEMINSIFNSAKQLSTYTNQLFNNLDKSFGEFKNFVTASSHIDVSLTRADGKNCLHLIAENEKAKIEDAKSKIDFLMERGLDINAKTQDGLTPLVLALKSLNFELFSYFSSKADCDISTINDQGQNLLHIILNLYDEKKPNTDLVQVASDFLQGGSKVSFLEKDHDGKHPLSLIVQKGLNKLLHLVFTNYLSEIQDSDWEGIVTDAVVFNHEVILRKALQYDQAKKFINDAGSDGKSLAQIALMSDNADILNLLKEFNADFSVCDEDGNSLGHLAVTKPKVMKYLLDNKHIDLTAKNGSGEDIMTLAAKVGSKDVVDLLLENSESVINHIFVTAISSGHLDVVKHILDDKQKMKQNNKVGNTIEVPICQKYKLDLSFKDDGGNFLQKAISSFSIVKDEGKKKKIIETIDYFLNFLKESVSAILNVVNMHGDAPIHTAINLNSVDMVKMLVKHKADLNKRDVTKLSPLQIAIQENKGDIVKELLAGSDLDLCIQNAVSGQSLLHMGAKSTNTEILCDLWKVISAKSDIKNLIMQQDANKNNFLHIFISNDGIDDDKKSELIDKMLPVLRGDDFKRIFDQENSKRETVRNLLILNEKLKDKYLSELPEYVEDIALRVEEKTKKDIKKATRVEGEKIDVKILMEEIEGVKTTLGGLHEEFASFRELVLTEFQEIRDMLTVLGQNIHPE
jgi:ankyrin repeat protein